MQTLVIGGTGLIGTYVAQHLTERGHTVSIGARRQPQHDAPSTGYPVVVGDYSTNCYHQAASELIAVNPYVRGQVRGRHARSATLT